MTHATENKAASNLVEASREWVRPAVQHLAAGDADDETGPSLDGILNPS